jgi:ABC-2 type transport system permease protein
MTGFYAVLKKELQDKFSSWRFIVLFSVVLLASVYFIYNAAGLIRGSASGSPDFIFMALFTVGGGGDVDSFIKMAALGIPLLAIAFGWDAVNSEKNRGTLSRLVSQPIYRDNIINAKFAAGIVTLAIVMLSIILLVTGLGIRMLGVVPSAEEAWRLFFFLILGVIYGAFWLGLAILFSIVFRWVAASVLTSLGVLVLFGFGYTRIMSRLADALHPINETINSQIANVQFLIDTWRYSPVELFKESGGMVLMPGQRTWSDLLQILISSPTSAPMSSPLSINQSLSAVWPNIIIIFMLMVVCFAISYIIFMRQEIRAT